MQPLTPATLAALQAGNAAISVQVLIFDTGVQVASVVAQDAQVTVDRAASNRRRATVTAHVTTDLSVVPTSPTSKTAPFGNEMKILFGAAPPGQVPDSWIGMGVYVLTEADVTDTGHDLTVVLQGVDRSWVVDQYAFRAPYLVAAGSDVQATIQAILTLQAPALPALNMPPTIYSLPAATFKEGDKPWAAITTLAFSVGMEAFFDVNGAPTLKPIPDPTKATPVWTYAEGIQGNAPLTMKRKFIRDQIRNDFTVSGSGTGVTTPIRGQVKDTNPSSPTYVGGKYGDVAGFTTSNLVTSTQQAIDAATNQLLEAKGKVEQLTVTVKPNPALDIDDVVTFRRARIGVNGNYVLDAITVSARHDTPTTLTGRKATPL